MTSIEMGGPDFHPGSPETLTVTGLSATATSATLRFASNTLAIDGTHQGAGTWAFAFDADDSGAFAPTPGRFDAQLIYNDGSLVEAYLITGARKIGTEPSDPGSSGKVTEITLGTGLASTPNPITSTGTVSLDADLTDLNDVNSVAPIATGQVLKWNNGTGKYDPATPSLSDNSDFSSSAPANGDALTYNSTATDWEPTSPDDLAPATGSAVSVVGTAYSPAQDDQAPVKRRTFYHAASSGGTGGASATLISSGVEYVLRVQGWHEEQSTGDRVVMAPDHITCDSSGQVDYSSDVHPGTSNPWGYFIVLDYVESV